MFSVRVVVYKDGRIETYKYCGEELICETSGPDFETAMIHATLSGLAAETSASPGRYETVGNRD